MTKFDGMVHVKGHEQTKKNMSVTPKDCKPSNGIDRKVHAKSFSCKRPQDRAMKVVRE